MSTSVMAQCWPLQMPPVPKAVLVSLADNANDSGYCWPSLSTICERTCYGRTAVINAIQWLEEHGAVVANRENGRHTSYRITPSNYSATGPRGEPVREANQSGRRTGPRGEPVRQAHRSAKRTGTAGEPVRDTNPTRPPDGLDPSATRTGPVRHADTNRQEPSVEVGKSFSLSQSDTCASEGGLPPPVQPERETPLPANVRAAKLMIQAGAPRVNPSHAELIVAIAEGVTPEELGDTVTEGLTRNPPVTNPFLWAIATARNRRSSVTQRQPVVADPSFTQMAPVSAPRGAPSKTSEAVREALEMAGGSNG